MDSDATGLQFDHGGIRGGDLVLMKTQVCQNGQVLERCDIRDPFS